MAGPVKNGGGNSRKKADAVITITEYSKKQIVQYVGIHPTKMHAIHLAPKTASALQHTQVINETALNGTTRKYILHIGVLEKRKNLLNLIKAFDLLLKEGFEDYDLVLAGNKVAKSKIDDSENIHQLINDLGLQQRVLLPGFITDEQLAHYYSHASLYAFVSVNEGFGLPVLEAFQHHLPTLVADNSCLPEVGGDAVITCDPYDIVDIKDKMKMILEDITLQKILIEKGRQRLALFSWEKTTGQLLQVFKFL